MERRGARAGGTPLVVGAGLVLLGAVGAILSAGPRALAADPPTWESYVKGLEIKGLSSLRIQGKAPEVWYASVQGKDRGFCSSKDGGKTWVPLRQGLDKMLSDRDRYEITLDPKDPEILYLVWRGKIHKSSNAGTTWEKRADGTTTYSFDRHGNREWIAGVVVDPSKTAHLLAGTRTVGYKGGLFESSDGAKAWSHIAGTLAWDKTDPAHLQKSLLSHDAWPIAIDPRSDKYLVVGGARGACWASDDRGRTFKRTDPLGPDGIHTAYDLTLIQSREVFLAESRGLWRSRDGGEKWGSEPILAGACIAVEQDPSNRKRLYGIIAGVGLHRTEDVDKWSDPIQPEMDAHDVVAHPKKKDVVYVTSLTTGLWVSTDKGETFTQVVGDLPAAVPAVTHVAAHPKDSQKALAVTDTGAVFLSKDGGHTWERSGNVGRGVSHLSGDLAGPAAWLAAGPGVLRSEDFGKTWTAGLISPDPEERVVDVERLPDGTLLALWERGCKVASSKDGGKTWATETVGPGVAESSWGASLAVDARDANHLLLATRSVAETWVDGDKDGGPYESTDGGKTWTHLEVVALDAAGKATPIENANFGSVAAIDPATGTLFYGADGAGLFRREPSADPAKPSSWEESGPNSIIPKPTFNAFLMAPGATRGVIVMQVEGTNEIRAVVRSEDGGKTWATLGDPNAKFASLSADPSVPGRWMAGDVAGDRGVLVYEAPGSTPPPVPPSVPPTPPPAESTERPVEGSWAITGSDDKTGRIWDLHEGKAKATLTGHAGAIRALVLTADETRIYSGGEDKSIGIWNGASGEAMGSWKDLPAAVTALAVSADGSRLYAGDQQWTIYVWDPGAGKAIGKYEGHSGGITCLAVSSDGSRLWSASLDRTVRLWDTKAGKELVVFPAHPTEVLALAVSADGTRLYTGSRDKTVRVFDAATGAALSAIDTKQAAYVGSLALAPDGATLYAAGSGNDVESFTTADGKASGALTGSTKSVTSLAISHDGEWIVAGSEDALVRAWRKGKPAPAWTSAEGHTGPVYCLVLTPDTGVDAGAGAGTPPPAPPAMGEAPPPAMGDTPPPGMGEPPAMGGTPPAMDSK